MVILEKVNIHLENKTISRSFFVFIWMMYAVVYMTKNCFGAAMAQIVSEGILTKSQTGLITGIFYAIYAPLQIVGGILADKYSPEKLLKIGLMGAAVINILIFFNHNYYLMMLLWALNAVIQTPIWPSVFKIVSSQLVRSDRKNMIFLISFTSSFGLLMGYVAAAVIPSWEYNFLFSASALCICAVILHIFCIRLDGYMKNDKNEKQEKINKTAENRVSSVKLFALSGFFILLPAVLFRCMVEQGTKTLSPTMLMEVYKSVSSATGNLMNTLIIASGILGTLIIKFILYPRIIKNEVTGIFIMIILSLPCTIVLKTLGKIPIYMVVIALCGISVTLTATQILLSYFNLNFVPYGKNGAAAGISNAAASLGIVFESYGFVKVAETYSWNTVATLWVIMICIAAGFAAAAIPFSKKFINKKNYMEELYVKKY